MYLQYKNLFCSRALSIPLVISNYEDGVNRAGDLGIMDLRLRRIGLNLPELDRAQRITYM